MRVFGTYLVRLPTTLRLEWKRRILKLRQQYNDYGGYRARLDSENRRGRFTEN